MKVFLIKELFDGEKISRDMAIAVENETILWCGKNDECPYQDADTIDLGDTFVMPGLIDCHVHVAPIYVQKPFDEIDLGYYASVAISNLKLLQKEGVVALRDLGSPAGVVTGIAKAINEGLLEDLPRILSAGRPLCATGGHGFEISIECDGKDSFIEGARKTVKEGADIVKLMVSGGVNSHGKEPGPPELTKEEIKAGVDEAHAKGRKVAVHAHGHTAIKYSIEAGVDSVEHGVFLDETLADQMKEKGIFLVPTLCAPYYGAKEGMKNEPNNPDHKKSRDLIERHRKAVLMCQKKGIKIAMGTDAGTPYNPYDKVCFELVLLQESGLPMIEILKIATANGAQLIDSSELGYLKKGMQASFMCLDKSPIDDVKTLTREKQIWFKGKKISGGNE